METFQSLVAAVQENNKINEASWKDWVCSRHIQDVYGKLTCTNIQVAEVFLNALIRDDGHNLDVYLDAMHALEYGIVSER